MSGVLRNAIAGVTPRLRGGENKDCGYEAHADIHAAQTIWPRGTRFWPGSASLRAKRTWRLRRCQAGRFARKREGSVNLSDLKEAHHAPPEQHTSGLGNPLRSEGRMSMQLTRGIALVGCESSTTPSCGESSRSKKGPRRPEQKIQSGP